MDKLNLECIAQATQTQNGFRFSFCNDEDFELLYQENEFNQFHIVIDQLI